MRQYTNGRGIVTLLVGIFVILTICGAVLANGADTKTDSSHWWTRVLTSVFSIFRNSPDNEETANSSVTAESASVSATVNNLSASPSMGSDTPDDRIAEGSAPSEGITTRIPDSEVHRIRIPADEFYKWNRSYVVSLAGGEYIAPERKGTLINDYFRNLNVSDNPIYIGIQFDSRDGDPTFDQISALKADGIDLFRYTGDHTYWARAPRKTLEEKSYPYIRWIGVIEDPMLRISPKLYALTEGRNCTGDINITIEFYENIRREQYQTLLTEGARLQRGYDDEDYVFSKEEVRWLDATIDVKQLPRFAEHNFISKIGFMSPPSSVTGGIIRHVPINESFGIVCN